MNKKLQKAMRRQTELTAKLMADDITDKEKSELAKVNAQIKKATEPHKVTRKTNLVVMTLGEFKKWVDEVNGGDPSQDELAVLKYNLEQIKQQGVIDDDGQVAVQVLAKESHDDAMQRMEDRIAQLEQQINEKDDAPAPEGSSDEGDDNSDDDDDDGDDDSTNKGDAPTAMALALEALDATIKRFEELRQKFESGDVTLEEVYQTWPEYEIREMIEGAAAIMAKCDTVKELLDKLVPQVKDAQGDSGNSDDTDSDDADASGDSDDSDDTDGPDSSDDADGSDETSDDVKKFKSGQDLAPRSEGGTADYQMLKTGGKKLDGRVPGTPHSA